MKIGFDGNMFGTDLTYEIIWATQRTSASATVKSSTGATVGTVSNNLGGALQLEQAWARYHFPKTDFFVRAGEIKDPLYHEQFVSTRYQQATERSFAADIFCNGDGYTEGATVIYDPGTTFRAEVGVTHGMRADDTNQYLDYPNNGSFNAFDHGVAGRADTS